MFRVVLCSLSFATSNLLLQPFPGERNRNTFPRTEHTFDERTFTASCSVCVCVSHKRKERDY